MKKYRDNGAIGALLDEYEKGIIELQELIKEVSPQELKLIVDPETKDPDCRSIQTILTHVVRAGYCYVVEIRRHLKEDVDFIDRETLPTIEAYHAALDKMFDFNVQLFKDHPNIALDEYDCSKKIKVKWGQYYDVEQLFEHAIVHVLRHRRQIERFLIKLRNLTY